MIDQFKKIGPGERQVADARSALMRDLETNSGRNDYLLNRLVFKYQYGEDVNEVFNMRSLLRPAHRADAARRGAGVPRHEPLRAGHADAGDEIAPEVTPDDGLDRGTGSVEDERLRLRTAALLGFFKPVEQAPGVGSRECFQAVRLALLDGVACDGA